MFIAIVPAFNEEKRIGSVVRSLFHHVDKVVVIDDASEDKTAKEAEAAGATVLRHAINRGQGAALETGHAYARATQADYVIHFDGDGQFDAADIAPALTALQASGADILFGSRFMGRQSKVPWLKQYIILPLARLFDRVVGGLPLADSHNGFRILTKHALSKIEITQDRMAHASEIPMLVRRHHLRYVEFPITVTYHEYGQRMCGGFRIIRDILLGKLIK